MDAIEQLAEAALQRDSLRLRSLVQDMIHAKTKRLLYGRRKSARFVSLSSYVLLKELKIQFASSAFAAQPRMRPETMKKTPANKPREVEEVSAEYRFDYIKAKPTQPLRESYERESASCRARS